MENTLKGDGIAAMWPGAVGISFKPGMWIDKENGNVLGMLWVCFGDVLEMCWNEVR